MKKQTLAFLALFLAGWSALQGQQLDDTWTVSVYGRHVQVNPDGSFEIPNVVLLDEFGASQQDRFDSLSDDFLRMTGFSLAGDQARYVASAFVQLERGGQGLTLNADDYTFTTEPPAAPEFIRLGLASAPDLRVNNPSIVLSSVGEQVQLKTMAYAGDSTASFTDNPGSDVTARSSFTSYRSTNPRIATVNENGLVTARNRGTVYITAMNDLVSSSKRVEVEVPITTTIVGRTTPGSTVQIPELGLTLTADSSGRFEALGVPIPDGLTEITIETTLGGGGTFSEVIALMPDGVTDVGILSNFAPTFTSTPNTVFDIGAAVGTVSPAGIALSLAEGETVAQQVSFTVPEGGGFTGDVEVVFVVDETGSMSGEHAWLSQMVTELDAALRLRGIESALYHLVGFERTPRLLNPTPAGISAADMSDLMTARLQTGGSVEEGYIAMRAGLQDLEFREGAAVNVVMVADEDRDIRDAALDYDTMLQLLLDGSAVLNSVVNMSYESQDGSDLVGVDAFDRGYLADGTGGFTVVQDPVFQSAAGTTRRDYIDLAFATGGAAWDLNQLRDGGDAAVSFTNAFIAVKADEIIQQVSVLDVRATGAGEAANTSGQVTGLQSGDTAMFDVSVTENGETQFELEFFNPDSGQAFGSIPVSINRPFTYTARADDINGDTISYNLVQAPAGAAIDPVTGILTWIPTGVGDFPFEITASDSLGMAVQSFVLQVTAGSIAP